MAQALLKTDSEAKKRQGNPAWQKGVRVPGARPWAKGVSGNPGGIGGNFVKAQMIYREASPEAARVMVGLMDDPDPRVRGFAADKVMERAWGKARDYDPKNEAPDQPPIDPAQFPPAVRAQMRRVMELLLKAMPAEAEVIEGEAVAAEKPE